MKTIHKYTLLITDELQIWLPQGAELLDVQNQNERLCLWVLAEPDAEKECRHFRIVGTGNPIPDAHKLTFVGTVQMKNGALVWHVFEKETVNG